MKGKMGLILLVVLTVVWCTSSYAMQNITEGKWEITSRVVMEGLPMAVPPVKTTMCLSNKEAVPQKAQKNQNCKMISNKVLGDTVTWAMQCRDKNGTTDSEGKITYKGSSFDGKVVVNMKNKEGSQKITQNMHGKRIGNCQEVAR
ncbi:MAG: DUF3617 domain-containing protein [Acidobacteriota bacterium]